MSFPQNKVTRRRGGTVFLIDLDIDDPGAAAARDALRRGNFEPAQTLLRAAADPNERAYYAEALGDWPGEASFLRTWVDRTGSVDAFLVSAIQRIKWAWEARGGSEGAGVSAAAWREFAKRLPLARQSLLEALKRNPRDATACPWLMWCARGLGDRRLSEKALGEAVQRCPDLRSAYSSALLTVSDSWYGSQEEMFEFARRYGAPGGAAPGAPVLIIEAHYYAFEGLPVTDPHRKTYWARLAVRDDVIAANDACTRQGFHGMNGLRTRHWLAYGPWKCGEHAAAAAHFEAIGGTWNQWPWGGLRRGFNWLFNSFGRARRQCARAV